MSEQLTDAQRRLMTSDPDAAYGDMLDAARARAAGETFMLLHAELKPCVENAKIIVGVLERDKLGPSVRNFEFAFRNLVKQPNHGGLIFEGEPRESSAAAQFGADPSEPAGDSRSVSDAEFLQEIERIPSAEYKRRYASEAGFADRVNRLLKQPEIGR